MKLEALWAARLGAAGKRSATFFWVVCIYLASEVVIWGLSRTLAPVKLQFFSSIFGMVLTFILMTALHLGYSECELIYQRHVKSKVDFINAHLGVGFPIPLVMLNESAMLDGHAIARIIGNFVVTNIASWSTVFIISIAALVLISRRNTPQENDDPERSIQHNSGPLTTSPPQIELTWPSQTTLYPSYEPSERSRKHDTDRTPHSTVSPAQRAPNSEEWSVASPEAVELKTPSVWRLCCIGFPLFASFLGIFLLGVPIAAATREQRILDGFVLWFCWIGPVLLQRWLRRSIVCQGFPQLKGSMVTLTNPVLIATLLLTAYTRGKAEAYPKEGLQYVLDTFSSGTPIYSLWTSMATNKPPPHGSRNWFGAGDAALSVLECGIFIWGFKLYECRSQLFSKAGAVTIVVSITAAAGNVFLSVLCGRALGLARAECLAFAARSTTLALAKPAVGAVGGNLGANAGLVVSNGILGQLLYPFALPKLGVKEQAEGALDGSSDDGSDQGQPRSSDRGDSMRDSQPATKDSDEDDAMTIAAGITIGVNGAAMGVSYLYGIRSRAAPYAALAMVVFGVFTVIFTTLGPFRSVLAAIAEG